MGQRSEMEVKAEMAGTIVEIEIAAGAKVAKGDQLLLLESMKMEMPILAPCAGQISSFAVEEGEVVQEGQVLVILE